MDLQQKHIVVTGGAGALGREVVAMLLQQEAICHVPVHRQEVAGELKKYIETKKISYNGLRIYENTDLADENDTLGFYNAVSDKGNLWASVNLAGGFGMGAIGKLSTENLAHMWRINVATCFNCCKAAIGVFKSQNSKGYIVNIASRPGECPEQGAGLSAYAASKAAVVAITRSLAAEMKEKGIHINAISPSIIDTPANRKNMPDADYSKWPVPDEIARVICSLIYPTNTLVNGAVIPVYGQV